MAQSAFVKGRSITDNILMAQELFRGYNRESGTAKCALKFDLHKAFDSIRDSILHTMNSLSQFTDLSGLTPSIHKSIVFLSNCDPDVVSWFDTAYHHQA
ncbi:hypothetical protein AgCh_023212 [Apium graveolens]